MKKFLTALMFTAATLFASQAVAQDLPGEGVSVQPAVATWQSALPIEAIFASLLERLGYDVQPAQSVSNPIFYQAVVQGDVDYWANGWFPLHNTQLPASFDGNAEVVGTIVENGAIQGYLADAESVEEFGITSLEDFKRPEVKEAFDANGDGKADLVACPPGWGCELVIEHHLDAYDLRDHVNDIKASYSASFADALARYRNGDPVLFYTWTPNFTVVELVPGEDVTWINVPEVAPTEGQEGFEDSMVASDVVGAVSDPLTFGFVANDINAVANSDFLEANPAARSMLESIEIPLGDVSDMTQRIANGESSDAQIAAMAQEWLDANADLVDGWVAAAIDAAN